jgi:hypothetical protein
LGLILPENFDGSLKSGNHSSLTLYFNGTTVNTQTEALLQTAILEYARTIANMQTPVTINTMVINTPSSSNAGAQLG